MTNVYTIRYIMKKHDFGNTKSISVIANNKADAWLVGKDAIKTKEGAFGAGHWVASVTYQNGNQRFFNTDYNKPY